jgi:hypothetical protein
VIQKQVSCASGTGRGSGEYPVNISSTGEIFRHFGKSEKVCVNKAEFGDALFLKDFIKHLA